MARYLAPLFILVAAPALAHPGFHPNPHWLGYGWMIAGVIGAVLAYALQRVRK